MDRSIHAISQHPAAYPFAFAEELVVYRYNHPYLGCLSGMFCV